MNDNNAISIKPIKDLFGLKFFIPNYQRGYRWDAQQAIDLLEDISAFMKKTNGNPSEIYCIQPLVVQSKEEDNLLEDVRRAESIEKVKELLQSSSWSVIDGQQRLTTIYLILSCLGKNSYFIKYETREESEEYLQNFSEDKNKNIDYYHLFNVKTAIEEWKKNKINEISDFTEVLLNKVCFIWYEVKDEDPISVFTRLNIGKIPLTDSELIKAMFLNRKNFQGQERDLELMQHEIAAEWDSIEYALQNDEFWYFIHNAKYDKPTRIDYIFDLMVENDKGELYDKSKRRSNNRKEQREKNDALEKRIGNDEHKTFRYFYEWFSRKENGSDRNWLKAIWKDAKGYYQIFREWYSDYKLYHYIGYLICMKDLFPERRKEIAIEILADDWYKSSKDEFLDKLKSKIKDLLNKNPGFENLEDFVYDLKEEKSADKTKCVPILLLHNIETIIQQNEKLVGESKYNLPNFTKFPFHLYKKEKWNVEHIRPNAGDGLEKDEDRKLYLLIAKEYLSSEKELIREVDEYLKDTTEKTNEKFQHVYEKILSVGNVLPDADKNKIWNFALLDESTNKEYGNAIFPVKRAFLNNKERGKKVKYKMEDGKLKEVEERDEIAFVPPCTRNIFAKTYTSVPKNMLAWTKEDAENYLNDINSKLKEYLRGE